MRTRCELWGEELLYMQAALLAREATCQLAEPFVLLMMRLEELFARRRVLRTRQIERAAHLQAFRQDAHAAVEALWQKVQVLQKLGELLSRAAIPLKAWVVGPSRTVPGGAALARLLSQLDEISTHPECTELIYLLQELQLEIEMDEREAIEDQLREEELAIDAEETDRKAAALVDATERRLTSLFFANPRMVHSFFMTGKKPEPKMKQVL
ncbi:hypothetical protein KKD52_06835 [Myxococcota bacterium]|nr:hypothetical protein [Myxococcota bacterium]